MRYFTKYISLAVISLFFIPAVSFAATAATAQRQNQAASLSAQLSQIESELVAGNASASATFSLSPGQSIQEATSSDSDGTLTITLPKFLHTTPDSTLPPIVKQAITQYAEITLEYDPCVAVAPSVCVAEASSSYPVMTSILSQGQDTGYLHYIITLTGLSTTTATFTITDSSYITSIQNEINEVAAQVHALLGQ